MQNNNYLEIKLETNKQFDCDTLEEALFAGGALSITLTSKEDEVILIEPEPGNSPLWEQGIIVTGLFAKDCDINESLRVIKLCLETENIPLIETSKLENKNWELEWTKYFKPIQFGKNLWVCPSNQSVVKDKLTKDTQIITLDPGLAFGTGTHPTTAMALEYIATNNCENKMVVDYGCGSGILGIAALKMNAKHCLMTDIDEKAIQTTVENSKINNVINNITPIEGIEIKDNYADLLIANILFTPLIELKNEFRRIGKKNSTIILTGLLKEQADSIIKHYENDYSNLEITTKEDWVMITGIKNA